MGCKIGPLTWGSDMTDSQKGRGSEGEGADSANAQPEKTFLAPRADYQDTTRRKEGWNQKAESLVIDMTGGEPRALLRVKSKTIPMTMDLPEHEHLKLLHAHKEEAKPMKFLARECMLIGLRVKEAYRQGYKVAVVGASGRIKHTIGP